MVIAILARKLRMRSCLARYKMIVGPDYPAPGGNSFESFGNSDRNVGQTGPMVYCMLGQHP